MDIREVRESGLLEQYVLGLLSEVEQKQVESYLSEYPELKSDIFSIQGALQKYAETYGIQPKPLLEGKILEEIRSRGGITNNSAIGDKTKSNNINLWSGLTVLLGLVALGTLWYSYKLIDENKDLKSTIKETILACDSVDQINKTYIKYYESMLSFETTKLDFTPTKGYPEVGLKFYYNPTQKENFIQINNLPVIDSNHTFQLWSLKEGEAPIPLDLFTGQKGAVLPVKFIDGTKTYAITIEKAGGVESPTLDRLIGTVGV